MIHTTVGLRRATQDICYSDRKSSPEEAISSVAEAAVASMGAAAAAVASRSLATTPPTLSLSDQLDAWIASGATEAEKQQRIATKNQILNMGSSSHSSIELDLTGYRGTLDGIQFPASLDFLILRNCSSPLVALPARLQTLHLYNYSGPSLAGLPDNLRTLEISNYSGPLAGLPDNLHTLNLGNYSGPLAGLPDNLQNLKLWNYSGPLAGLPDNLHTLNLGNYSGPLAGLPDNLQNLKLWNYSGPLAGLPDNLHTLNLGNYRGPLAGLPDNLHTLKLYDYTGPPLAGLPANLCIIECLRNVDLRGAIFHSGMIVIDPNGSQISTKRLIEMEVTVIPEDGLVRLTHALATFPAGLKGLSLIQKQPTVSLEGVALHSSFYYGETEEDLMKKGVTFFAGGALFSS